MVGQHNTIFFKCPIDRFSNKMIGICYTFVSFLWIVICSVSEFLIIVALNKISKTWIVRIRFRSLFINLAKPQLKYFLFDSIVIKAQAMRAYLYADAANLRFRLGLDLVWVLVPKVSTNKQDVLS